MSSSQEPPPSYDSLYGKVKAAKTESSGIVDFFRKFAVIVLSTLGCTICIGILLVIPIAMIVVGSLYVHDCPQERFIPIYLIVGGVFGLLKNLSNLAQQIRNKKTDSEEANARTNPFDGILGCFLLAWFIAGSVWVYGSYGKFTTEDPTAANYCHPTVYWCAFVLITITYIVCALSCLCACCSCLFACMGSKEDNPA